MGKASCADFKCYLFEDLQKRLKFLKSTHTILTMIFNLELARSMTTDVVLKM